MDIDTQINARWIIPIKPQRRVYENHAIAISNGHIRAIIPQDQAAKQLHANEVLDLNEHIVMPGLINAHTCSAMSLINLQSVPPDHQKQVLGHLQSHDLVSPQFVKTGSEFAIAQMLRSGITCFNDMYLFPDESIAAVHRAQLRATIGLVITDKASPVAGSRDEYIHKAIKLHDHYKHDARIQFMLAFYSLQHISDSTLERIRVISDELDLPIHINLLGSKNESEYSIKEYGCRPIERLHQTGLLGPSLVSVGVCHIEKEEQTLIRTHKPKVVHCPEISLRQTQPSYPIGKFLKYNIKLAFGTGNPAYNGACDLFTTMRLAKLLSQSSLYPLDSFQTLALATLGGAKVLGLDHSLGSIQKDKVADLIAIRCEGIHIPIHNLADYVVHSAACRDVSHVWVNGQCLLDKGTLTTIDEQVLMEDVKAWQQKLNVIYAQ